MWKTIKNIPRATWQWLSGKKRWIAITAGLISKLLPEHTFGYQATTFIKENAELIFEVVGTIAVGEIVVQKAKQKLPEGLSKELTEKIKAKIQMKFHKEKDGSENDNIN